MKRGEVWWADLPFPIGHRPVVLLSRDEAYIYRDFVTVAPISRRIRGIRAEVTLGPNDGLPRICAVNLDSMTTIPKNSLQRYITDLELQKVRAVDSAIHFALGWKSDVQGGLRRFGYSGTGKQSPQELALYMLAPVEIATTGEVEPEGITQVTPTGTAAAEHWMKQ